MIGYPPPITTALPRTEVPDAFAAIEELSTRVPGYWYINMMAVMPEARRKGFGIALLNEAAVRARSGECPGLTLIVAATNISAIRTYTRSGYREVARRQFNLEESDLEPTEALLMVNETP